MLARYGDDGQKACQQIPVVYNQNRYDGNFRRVSLLKTEIVENEHKHKRLKCTFRAETGASSWTQATFTAIKCDPHQRSVDDELNPTDYYLTLETHTAPGVGTGSGPTPNLEFSLDFGMPWKGSSAGTIYHLSFAAGMSGGWNRWLLYKLQLNLENPQASFDYVKTYCYCQGQIVPMEDLPGLRRSS